VYTANELRSLLEQELVQLAEEGCQVRAYRDQFKAAGADVAKLLRLYDRLAGLEPSKAFGYEEPNDLAAIRRLRPRGPRRMRTKVSSRRLRDRIRGAFIGRCAGCMVGKPVEGWTRDRIFEALKKDRAFPLDGYFRESTIRKGGVKRDRPWCTRGHITCMERDDDTDYTILGIHYLKTYGPRFTTHHVANEWLQRLPYHMVYTAERVAYRNLVCGIPPEQAGRYRNPYREWIGAQIRADGFGYCAAGWPQKAAEFAYRDAILSHTKNGIYGEMLFAAMIAAATVCDDLLEVIHVGLSEIPANCRLAEAVRDTMTWAQEHRDWTDTLDAIYAKYGRYHPVHTINNAALIVMGLLHGKMNFGKTVCITVMGGWDTDCTGATAGSVIGAMLGAERLPAKWVRPLRDTIRSMVVGYDNVRITELADVAWRINAGLRK